jgi:hypothetical protein
MTPVDKDDFEDAELARRLAAMPQPEPSAELDAAIFAQVQKDLAPGPTAANDPATEPARPSLLHRYRAPLAFAASLAGIAILLPVFHTMQHKEARQVNVQVISEDTVLPAPPPIESAELAAPAAPPEPKRDAGIASERREKPAPPPAPPESLPASPVLAMPAPVPAPVMPSIPAGEFARAPAPVPAPTAPAAAPEYPLIPESARAAPPAVPDYAPRPLPAPEPAAAPPVAKAATAVRVTGSSIQVLPPKEWLNSIEHLLDEGETAAAAEQWKRFRQAYPDYPVPDAMAERLKVLK